MATASSGPGPGPPEPGRLTPAPSGPGCAALCPARVLVVSRVAVLVLVLAASGGSRDRRTPEDSPADAKHQTERLPQSFNVNVLVDFKSTSLPSAAPFLLWSESTSSLTLTPSPQLPSHSPEVWSSAVTSTGDIIYMISVCAWLCVCACVPPVCCAPEAHPCAPAECSWSRRPPAELQHQTCCPGKPESAPAACRSRSTSASVTKQTSSSSNLFQHGVKS